MDQANVLVIIIIVVVVDLALSHHMKHGPVRVHTWRRLTSVHIADEALRHRDPLEHGVWRWHWSSAMATDGEHSFLAVRIMDP